jgi:ABC-type bacteriocin/lantibiotic exporter with double-glycine peptidase domain
MTQLRPVGLIIMVGMTMASILWYPHHFLDGTQYLGREGVFFQQSHSDCGGAALKMIFDYFGIPIEYGKLLQRLRTGPDGTTMLSIKQLAEAEGLLCEGWRLAARDLPGIPLPAVLLLRRNHFVVVASMRPGEGILILDPVRGRIRISVAKLVSVWKGETLLFCKPGADANRYMRWFLRLHNSAAANTTDSQQSRRWPHPGGRK